MCLCFLYRPLVSVFFVSSSPLVTNFQWRWNKNIHNFPFPLIIKSRWIATGLHDMSSTSLRYSKSSSFERLSCLMISKIQGRHFTLIFVFRTQKNVLFFCGETNARHACYFFALYSKTPLRISPIFCMSLEDNRAPCLSKIVFLQKNLNPGL